MINIQSFSKTKLNSTSSSNSSNVFNQSAATTTNECSFDNYFYVDEDGNLHTKYNFVGDKGVSAYGVSDEDTTSAGASFWGGITGTLQNQTDLWTALQSKSNTTHTHVASDITNLTIPTKTSDLVNDSGFITAGTGGSDWTEDAIKNVKVNNSHAVDGYHASTHKIDSSFFNRIPVVNTDGVIEIGKYIDFHADASDNDDYAVRLYAASDLELVTSANFTANKFILGSASFEWDSSNNAIKVNGNIYATGDVSAYGKGSSSSGSTADILSLATIVEQLQNKVNALERQIAEGGSGSGTTTYYIQKISDIGTLSSSAEQSLSLFNYISTNGTPKCNLVGVSIVSTNNVLRLVIDANTDTVDHNWNVDIYLNEDNTKKVTLSFVHPAAQSSTEEPETPTPDPETPTGLDALTVVGEVTDYGTKINVTGVSGDYELYYLDSNGNKLTGFDKFTK